MDNGIIITIYAAWNIVVCLLYGVDKSRAIHNAQGAAAKRRMRERTLLAAAFLMGALGALVGMVIFRHKTSHLKFRLFIPLAMAANVGLGQWIAQIIG